MRSVESWFNFEYDKIVYRGDSEEIDIDKLELLMFQLETVLNILIENEKFYLYAKVKKNSK